MNARVEAAAKAAHEFDTAHCPSFTWESAAEGWRKADRERQAAALAAADQIMFSESAIERAAKALRAEFSVDDQVGEYDATAVWGTPPDIARAVVAALREGA